MSQDGLEISEISADEFRAFARRHATSPEIGPIKTDLEDRSDPAPGTERILVGLRGCGKLCAAACLLVIQSRLNQDQQVVKLDSVIVDHALRRRGLADLLVTQSFLDLVSSGARNICRIYAHSVHPATVRLLRRLTFNDPQVTGRRYRTWAWTTRAAMTSSRPARLRSAAMWSNCDCNANFAVSATSARGPGVCREAKSRDSKL